MNTCSSCAPEHLDLRHVLDLQQARARRLDVVAQFAEREAVGGERVDDAERVAEVVVQERPEHALRQRAAHVADVLADLVPDVRDRRGRRRLLEVDEDRRLAGGRVAADRAQVAGLLQRALEALGDLLQRLLDRRAGPRRRHDHGADGDRRIFAAPEAHERQRAGDDRDDHQEDDERGRLSPHSERFGPITASSRAGEPSGRGAAPGCRR